jgi:hypothetical protein
MNTLSDTADYGPPERPPGHESVWQAGAEPLD